MKLTVVTTEKAPAPVGPYSQAVKANGFLFVSGQIPLDPATGAVKAGGVQAEAAQVLDNLKAVLEAGGCGLGDVVKTTIFLADMNDFGKVNEVYAKYFTSAPPARATVQVARLPKDVKVEIECIAAVPGK